MMLVVANETVVHGGIHADWSWAGSYAGSGGSIYLITGKLSGNGKISAGSPGNTPVSTGGGGRIALILTNSADWGDVSLSAASAPASGSSYSGAAGTIYVQTPGQGAGGGTLLINAEGVVASPLSTTLINDKVTDTVVGDLINTNSARLKIAAGQSLTVLGDWRNHAAFEGLDAGATVILAGPRPATVTGDNAFGNLTAGAPGKTITFADGSQTSVQGALILNGGSLVSGGVAPWYLTLGEAGIQEIGSVAVRNCDASGGQTLYAGTRSTDLGGNDNWVFPSSGTLLLVR